MLRMMSARTNTGVVADLPGYGRSVVRTRATPYEGISKRWMASVLAQAMTILVSHALPVSVTTAAAAWRIGSPSITRVT